MSSLGALMPGSVVTERWESIEDARAWAGLPRPRLLEILGAIGDQELTDLMVLASIPPPEMRAAMVAVRRQVEAQAGSQGDAGLNIIEKSRFNLLYNAVRRKFSMNIGDLLEVPQGAAPSGAGPATAQAAVAGHIAGATVKIKLSQTIIQGKDMEVESLPPEVIRVKRELYVTVVGDVPMPECQVTDIQLSVFIRVVDMGMSPACDFGVWGPHGTRMERAMFFTVHFAGPDGKWRATELKGPENIEAWEACWEVFKTAAIMANLASVANLDYYAKKFKTRVARYHWAWHLAIQADWRCRTEWWVEEKRAQESFHASSPRLSAYEPERPWNSVIKASAKNTDFWHEHLSEPAVLYRQSGGPDNSAKGSGAHTGAPRRQRSRPPSRSPSRRRKRSRTPLRRAVRPGHGGSDEQRPDGRYLCAKDGTEICYAWSRNDGGCADACRGVPKRAHVCEFCRKEHRTIRCPDHPGWRPAATGPAATSSKRKAKGRLRK